MEANIGATTRAFLRATIPWIVGIALFMLLVVAAGPFQPSSDGVVPAWIHTFLNGCSMALTFAPFAGGVRLSRFVPTRTVILTGLALGAAHGAAGYFVSMYAVEYAEYYSRSEDARARLAPLGVNVPRVRRQYAAYARAHGETNTELSVEEPFAVPAAWWEFGIQAERAAAAQSILAAAAGYLLALLAGGLRPALRRRTLWMLGLAWAISFGFTAQMFADRMRGNLIRDNPYVDAWSILALHLALVLVLIPLARERRRD